MYYIGIMSGTSLDGIDAVLTDEDLRIVETYSTSFPDDLKADLQKLVSTFEIHLKKLGQIDARLGICYARAASSLIKKSRIKASDVKAVGCHGQTVFHDPRSKYPFTMQIGDANRIAALTGINAVSDFRRMDIAAGGDGAPLAPGFHNAFFRSKKETRVILNLGGIANVTILDRSSKKVLGFDTGPANCLMDLWIQKNKNIKYDKDGKWAASGMVDSSLLASMLKENYFSLPPPKSTGKELFNLNWLNSKLKNKNIDAKSVQATLCELTAATVALSIKKYASDTGTLFLCGGGAYNRQLKKRLAYHLPKVKITITDELGISAKWVEAVAFAWLAKQRMDCMPGNIPSVTGAKRKVILGALYEA